MRRVIMSVKGAQSVCNLGKLPVTNYNYSNYSNQVNSMVTGL